MGQTSLTDTSYVTYENYFWYFLIAAFIFLITEFFIPEKKKMREHVMKTSVATIALLFICNFSFGQNVKKEIKKGND